MNQSFNKERSFICPSCGSSQRFAPKEGQLKCENCGRLETIPNGSEQVVEHSFLDYLKIASSQPIIENSKELSCKNCSAAIIIPAEESASVCSFCSSPLVLDEANKSPAIAPQAVLPCLLDTQQANKAFAAWVKSRWFAPNRFSLLARQTELRGVYLPFWSFDSLGISYFSGARGDYYYTQESYQTQENGRTVTRTRRVRHTRWSDSSGMVEDWFDDILVAAASPLPKEIVYKLEPWDLNSLVDYNSSYLAGFAVVKSQLPLENGFSEFQELVQDTIEESVKNEIGGDEQRIDSINSTFTAITFKHLLLPVYVGSYRFKDKLYQFAINARTGELQGERPISWLKITGLVLLIVATYFVGLHFLPSGK